MARRVATVLALAAVALASGCGDDSGSGGGRRVVATTTQLADFARQVGRGRVEVEQILQPGTDPHAYEPRLSDTTELASAAVVLRSGGEVDEWLDDLLDDAGSDALSVDVGESVRGRRGDPHWWQDPRNALRAVEAVRALLSKADPAGRARYAQNAAAYARRLRALDSSVAACLARVPAAKRRLVTTHDALGHYADRYGLEVVGAVIPSRSTQAQPSSRDVGRLVAQIRREGVEAVFTESAGRTKLEDAVARESGASVGARLWTDALGPKGSDGETYVESIASNTAKIARGLSGGSVSCRLRTL
jgi:ABC-type Zn uptake system ZnuABC Zn-binding protein ZnuA